MWTFLLYDKNETSNDAFHLAPNSSNNNEEKFHKLNFLLLLCFLFSILMKRHPDARMLLGVEVLLDLDSFSSSVFYFFFRSPWWCIFQTIKTSVDCLMIEFNSRLNHFSGYCRRRKIPSRNEKGWCISYLRKRRTLTKTGCCCLTSSISSPSCFFLLLFFVFIFNSSPISLSFATPFFFVFDVDDCRQLSETSTTTMMMLQK